VRTGRVIRELVPPETRLAHAAMASLRPRFEDEGGFVEQVDAVQRPEGYRLVAAFTDAADHAVAAAGFRVAHSLAWGAYLYVDDLATVPEARKHGHAGAILEWLKDEAAGLGCDQVHLDSGTGPDRFDAHRLYHSHGLAIHAHHFAGSPRSRRQRQVPPT
jgi:GNAT superfamily N-acetyltransferase